MQLKPALYEATKLTINLSFVAALILAGCGGGGGGYSATSPNVIGGMASKGPLNGSNVCAYAIASGVKATAIGSCAMNIVNGNYSIDLGTYTGPLLLEATGGTYTDEATGTSAVLASPLRSVLTNVTGSSSVAVTALTELAYQQANAAAGGLTSANILSAITNVQRSFGVADIVNTMPVDALNVPATATSAQMTYALALAAVSEFKSAQPAGTTLDNALQIIHTCLSAPSTGCGTGSTSVGAILYSGSTAFQNGHRAFSGLANPVANLVSLPTANPAPTATPGAPSVIGTNPSTGVAGTAVTITGTNFDTTPANNTVKFNGTAAAVTAATATSLTVTVASGATSGAISVTTAGGIATSAGSFTVTTITGGTNSGGGTTLPSSYNLAGVTANGIPVGGNLILPVAVGSHTYYYWDASGDGTSAGIDTVFHDQLDQIFNGGILADNTKDTTDTTGNIVTLSNGIRIHLLTQAELSALFTERGTPAGWAANNYYAAATQVRPGRHVGVMPFGSVSDANAIVGIDDNVGLSNVAFEVLP